MRSSLSLVSAMLAVGLLGGCGVEAPVPDKPTWTDDVLPILQANCFHCHGATAVPYKYQAVRWDVYNLQDDMQSTDTAALFADVGFMESLDPGDPMGNTVKFTGAKKHAALIKLVVVLPPSDPGRMPPPPATPLSARDVQVLSNWADTKATLGKLSPNLKPTIHWLQKGKTYEVLDGDGDQVLGQLMCGDQTYPIDRSGGHTLASDATLPCMAKLSDGFDVVTATLK